MRTLLLGLVTMLAVPAVCEGQFVVYCDGDDQIQTYEGSTASSHVDWTACHRLTHITYKFECTPDDVDGERELYWRQDNESNYTKFATITVSSSNEIEVDGEVVGDPNQTVTLSWTYNSLVNKADPNIFRVRVDKITDGVTWESSAFWGPLGTPKADVDGDFNGNGKVEQADLDLVLNYWGEYSQDTPKEWLRAQPPEGGSVDQAELDRVLNNWGEECP